MYVSFVKTILAMATGCNLFVLNLALESAVLRIKSRWFGGLCGDWQQELREERL
jgi:hypothetical protein